VSPADKAHRQESRMLIIAGLGNPGRRYAGNRHNIGFMAADEIHRRHHFSPWRARFEGETSEGTLDGEKALLVKPATFMNESGRSVGQAMRFYKAKPSDVLVIYDELDLPPGKARLKAGGSAAGHRGLRSIESHIGKDFRRLRLGIGHPGARELVNGYVLRDFAKVDRDWLEPLLGAVAEHAPLLAGGEDSNFMNRVHLAMADDEEDAAPAKPDAGARRRAETTAAHADERSAGGAFAGLKRLFGRGQ
jgi:PTH1 family peptidyl-tRNA hydrolase